MDEIFYQVKIINNLSIKEFFFSIKENHKFVIIYTLNIKFVRIMNKYEINDIL